VAAGLDRSPVGALSDSIAFVLHSTRPVCLPAVPIRSRRAGQGVLSRVLTANLPAKITCDRFMQQTPWMPVTSAVSLVFLDDVSMTSSSTWYSSEPPVKCRTCYGSWRWSGFMVAVTASRRSLASAFVFVWGWSSAPVRCARVVLHAIRPTPNDRFGRGSAT
jgi:hypothetical protein